MRAIRSTLTPAEKEEREIERLSRPAPSKKPPRHDLRRELVRDEDSTADKDEDRDMSLNYKRVSFARWAAKVPQDKRPKEPGDYWQTESAWGVWPQGSKNTTSAPDEESAKEMAKGSKQGPASAPPPPKSKVPSDPQDEERKLRGQIDKVLSKADAGGDPLAKKALAAVLSLKDKEFKEAAKALVARVQERKSSLVDGQPSWAAEAAEAAEAAMDADPDDLSPEDKGLRAAELLFADRVLTNPANLAGQPLSNKPLSDADLRKRSEQSFQAFRDLSPKLREAALSKAAASLQTIKVGDPRRAEIDGIVDGLALACYLEGEDPVAEIQVSPPPKPKDKEKEKERLPKGEADKLFPFAAGAFNDSDDELNDILRGKGTRKEFRLRPAMSESFGKLARLLDNEGSATSLLMGAEEFYGPKGRSAVSGALDQASSEDFAKFLEDTPFAEVGDALLEESLGPAQMAVLRDAAKRMTLEDMTTLQGVIVAMQDKPARAPKSGKRRPGRKDDLGKTVREQAAQDAELAKAIKDTVRCLSGGASSEECEQKVVGLVLAGLEAFDRAMEHVAKDEQREIDPADPHIAKMRHAIRTGDLDVLDQIVVKPKPRPRPKSKPPQNKAGSISALSGPRDREDITKMAKKPTPISRTAANEIALGLDKITNLVVNEASALGVPEKLAAQFAAHADQIADLIDKKAGIKRAAAQKTAADFNPEEIGEEVSGPLLDGTPEPYMKGEWTQQENRELLDRYQQGAMTNGKVTPDPRNPTPGAQMRPLAKSLKASADKLAALAEMGQATPQQLADAEQALRLASKVLEGKKD